MYTNYKTIIEKVDTFVKRKDKSVISSGGEVIVPSSGESSKDIARASVIREPGIIIGGDLNIIKLNGGLDPVFLALSISNGILQRELRKRAQGKSIVHLHNSDLKQVDLFIPDTNVEQQKIGCFIQQLDDTIALHQRKLDKLKQLKKGLLQVMFPQKREIVPKLRFADFHSEWTQRKLGDLAEIVRGSSPRPIQNPKWFDEKSDIGWLRIADVTEQDGRIHYLEQRISKAAQEKTRVLNKPHLLLSIAATVGKPVINYVKTGVHDGFLIFMNPSFDREFMFQWLEMYRPKWQRYGQPGSQVNLNSALVKNQIIMLPSFEEQKVIGFFLKELDDQITLYKSKLEEIQLLRYIYLHNMLI